MAGVYLAPPAVSHAAERIPAEFAATEEPEGYARLVFSFEDLPEHDVRIDSGVLIVAFEEPLRAAIDPTTLKAPSFISIGRVDPDGKAFRFALVRSLRVNTIVAGEKLFVDLLPSNWSGLPPGLPEEVIAELARRAEEAEQAALAAARREAMLNSRYKVNVRVGEHPTFSRIVFDWNTEIDASVQRSGDKVVILFDQFAKPDLGRLRADPPNFVGGASIIESDAGLGVEVVLEPGANIRAFREEQAYVLDVIAPPGVVLDENAASEVVLIDRAQDAMLPEAARDVVTIDAPTDAPTDVQPAVAVEAQADTPAVMPAMDESQPATVFAPGPVAEDSDAISPDDVPDVVVSAFYLNADGTGLRDSDARDEPVPEVAPQQAAAGIPAPVESSAVDADMPSATAPLASDTAGPDFSDTLVTVRTERDDAMLRIHFPFGKPVPSAVYRRTDMLWIVFDDARILDLSAIESGTADHIASVDAWRAGDSQILRLNLRQQSLASTEATGDTWTLNLGDTIITPAAPVSLRRGLRSDGRSMIMIDFADAGMTHELRDPDVGDSLTFVTGLGPQRGILKAQEFVEFTVLPSAHGLVIKPKTDDLSVRIEDDEVLITRAAGLTLSSSRMNFGPDGVEGSVDTTRPGYVDYDNWHRGGPGFVRRVRALEDAITSVEHSQTLSARLDLVRLYIANGLGAEALGQLALVAELDAEIVSDPMYLAMRGIANLHMHRPARALEDLTGFTLRDDPHSALWRGLAETELRKWQAAVHEFRSGEQVIGEYPDDVQARIRLAAARATLEVNDFAAADLHLQMMPQAGLSSAQRSEDELLRGRLLEGLGRAEEALEAYAKAVAGDDRLIETEARMRHAVIGHRLGVVSREDLRRELETLEVVWRGDELELETLHRLANLYTEDEDFLRALDVMKIAVKNYGNEAMSRAIYTDMAALFEDLFLGGKADLMSPIDALALYYEYRELTPVGRKGDEMIRKLADRLIAVDLLDQAAEILQHQVDKRLVGAARAQVAAKLALVHLMDREPAEALQAIRRTRQAVLPDHIQTQRRLIEARALSELQQTEAAIELLANVEGMEALQVRAEAYWRGERWQLAGESFEQAIGADPDPETPLSRDDRLYLLRAATSYVLANDPFGLKRLRERYRAHMRGTRDEHAFDVLTGNVDRNGIAFRNLAKEIAAIDTLDAFLDEFKSALEAPLVGADAAAAASAR